MLLVYFVCLLSLFLLVSKKKDEAYIQAVMIWVFSIYVLVETLSVRRNLDFSHVVGTISCLIIAIIFVNLRIMKVREIRVRNAIKFSWSNTSKNEKCILVMFSLFCLFCIMMSLISIPYEVDSLTYHLTRIAYWERNRTVAHFATNDVRAVTSPPLSEFINLIIYILNDKSDKFFNLLQTFSYITNSILVMGICRKLNISKKFSYLSMFLFATTPIVFAEAFTTQVDQFAALWTIMFIYLLLDLIEEEYRFSFSIDNFVKVLMLSACIGFEYLSKPTGLFAMLTFAIWLLIVCIKRKENIITVTAFLGIAVIVIIGIIAPEAMRNYETFYALSSSSVGTKHMVATFAPSYLLINFLKNISVNLPNVYFPYISEVFVRGVEWLAYKLGVDINSPLIAHDGAEYYVREPQTYIYDAAVNPIIMFFSCIVVGYLIWKMVKREKLEVLDRFSFWALLSFVFFCLTLKYEHYSVRYMIPYFALLCPAICGTLEQLKLYKIRIAGWLVSVMVFMCLVDFSGSVYYHAHIWWNHLRIEDRVEGYFYYRENDIVRYKELAEYLSRQEYDSLGVFFGWRAGEYPIWKMIDENIRIDVVNVQNETVKYLDEDFLPDYIVVKDADPKSIEEYKGFKYSLEKEIDDLIYLYRRSY